MPGVADDDENSAQTLEVLTNFTDFPSFKQMMLAEKERAEGAPKADQSVEYAETNLDSELQKVADMASTDKVKWKNIGGAKVRCPTVATHI